MITDDQITALAREYAEYATKADAGDPNLSDADINGIKRDVAEYAEGIIRWLSQRYCLAEKAMAKQFFQSRQNILANQDKYDRYIVDEASAEKRLMLCLFPEIAKEVDE